MPGLTIIVAVVAVLGLYLALVASAIALLRLLARYNAKRWPDRAGQKGGP